MTNDPTAKTLAELGVTDAAGVAFLFYDVKRRFITELARAAESGNWEAFRRSWEGPPSTVRSCVTSNWIQTAPENLRGQILKENEDLVGFVNLRLGVTQTLQELGVTNAEMVGPRFSTLEYNFDREIEACKDEADLGISKLAWTSRRSGLVTLISNNWLKQSSPELKGSVGQAFNKLNLT